MPLTIDGKWLLGGAALLGLASCATPEVRPPRGAASLPPVASPPREMVSDSPVKIGKPYQVGGVTYTPVDDLAYDEVGYASWYGEELSGNSTANGEAFNPGGVSAAHRTLPLPSYVEVTALATGRTILVRVNDRGPFSNDRLIDLSRGAAEQLGISGHGSAPVRVRRVNPPEQERVKLRSGQRAAQRIEAPDALLTALRKKLTETTPAGEGGPKLDYSIPADPADMSAHDGGGDPLPPSAKGYLVQLISFSSKERADKAAARAGAFVSRKDSIWRVRTGPYADQALARHGVQQAAASGFNGAQIVVND
ncbi:MAG: septal ring lytic transglycosylase RlpA family protein [Sphingobium sp.]